MYLILWHVANIYSGILQLNMNILGVHAQNFGCSGCMIKSIWRLLGCKVKPMFCGMAGPPSIGLSDFTLFPGSPQIWTPSSCHREFRNSAPGHSSMRFFPSFSSLWISISAVKASPLRFYLSSLYVSTIAFITPQL